MIIHWLEDAKDDLHAIHDYISQDNILAADRTLQKIFHAVEMLAEQTALGRPGRVLHTRELVVVDTPYIVPYQVRHQIIEILRVFHAARQWPAHFEDGS